MRDIIGDEYYKFQGFFEKAQEVAVYYGFKPIETPILEQRPQPPSAADRALMVQPEDVAAACLFAATMPARTCMAEILINPTDNNFYRAAAERIAAAGP